MVKKDCECEGLCGKDQLTSKEKCVLESGNEKKYVVVCLSKTREQDVLVFMLDNYIFTTNLHDAAQFTLTEIEQDISVFGKSCVAISLNRLLAKANRVETVYKQFLKEFLGGQDGSKC